MGGDEERTSERGHENVPEERWRPVRVFGMTKPYIPQSLCIEKGDIRLLWILGKKANYSVFKKYFYQFVNQSHGFVIVVPCFIS